MIIRIFTLLVFFLFSVHSISFPFSKGGESTHNNNYFPFSLVERNSFLISETNHFLKSDYSILRNNDQTNFDIILKTDFENNTIGKYQLTDFRRNFSQARNLRSDNTNQVGSIEGKKYLTHFYEKDKFGTATGMNEWALLDQSLRLEEVYFSFKFKMSEEFDFGLIAKFFGFVAGGVSTFPPHGTIGSNMGSYGSYVRLYWREDGTLEFNSKHHGMCATCTNVKFGLGRFGKIKPGQWQTYTMRVVMNTVGKANGIVQVWIDNVLVASVSDIIWRTEKSPQYFGEMMLDSFMGGDDYRFAPSKTQYMWQDNIHIWKYSNNYLTSNPSLKRGNQLWRIDEKLVTPIDVVSNTDSNSTFNMNVGSSPSNGGKVKVKLSN